MSSGQLETGQLSAHSQNLHIAAKDLTISQLCSSIDQRNIAMLQLQQAHDTAVNRCAHLESELAPFLGQTPAQNVSRNFMIT